MDEYLDFILHYRENANVKHFNREQLLDLQLRKFRRLVKHALTVSPFYRDLYAKAGISIHDIDGIYPQNCPIIQKKTLMENFDQIVADPNLKYEQLNRFLDQNPDPHKMYLDKYWIVHTSGSTGQSGLYPFSKNEFILLKILYIEYLLHLTPLDLLKQVFNKTKIAFFGAIHGHFAGVTLAASTPGFLYDQHFLSFLDPIEKVVDELNKFQPQLLTGYASSISQLAEAQMGGFLKIKPHTIICSGDAMYPSSREIIREAFGINPLNLYSCTEAPVLAWQTNDDTEEMYVSEHMYHLDLVEDKTCLSNLYLYTFPIIRYQMDDLIEFQERDSIFPFSRIKLKNVRALDTIEVINNQGQNEVIHPFIIVVLHVDGLEQFQFWKKPNNTILVKAKGSGENLKERVKAAVMKIMQERNADKVVHIEVEEVDNFPVDSKTGKFKLINAA